MDSATAPRPGSLLHRLILDPVRGPWILLATAALILFAMPGAPSLWTLEGRSAVICREMMRSGDYFHPYLFDEEYFDKPLLSYWLMIGAAKLLGGLTETALRLPGILAALIAIACTRFIGARRFGPAVGLTAGWLLATTVFFVYWARLACSDMLNLAGIMAAVAWYTARRDRPGAVTTTVFLVLLAVAAQLKGLIAPALTLLVIAPDLLRESRWRRHLRPSLAVAWIPAAAIYLAPFLIADATGQGRYGSSGLSLVYRENVVRYFSPFDHQGPITTYAVYLPLYALPWTLFLPAVVWRARGWKSLSPDATWPLLASALIFVFLTLSGSRRNYYLLPILPFIMLAIADWIQDPARAGSRRKAAGWLAAASAAGLLLYYGVALPIVARKGDTRTLAHEVRQTAESQAPWEEWRVVLYNTKPQMGYYLDPVVRARRLLNREELAEALRLHPRTIVVTYARMADSLEPDLGRCAVLRERSILPGSLGQPKKTGEAQVVFVPLLRTEVGITPVR